ALEEGMRRSIRWCVEQGLLDAGARGRAPASGRRGAGIAGPADANADPGTSRGVLPARDVAQRETASRYGCVVTALAAALSRRLLQEELDDECARRLTAAIIRTVARMPWHLRLPIV